MLWNTKQAASLKVRRVTLDIETMNPSPEALEMETRFLKAAGNIKDANKKAANLAKKQQAMEEKGGVSNSAPVACIGTLFDGLPLFFSAFPSRFTDDEKAVLAGMGITLFEADSEVAIMMQFAGVINALCDENTRLVTHNGKDFDMPKIRLAFARNNISPIPRVLLHNFVSDTMIHFYASFSCKHEGNGKTPFISLEEVCAQVRVPFTKGMEAAEVPAAIVRGERLKVALYCMADVMATNSADLRMGD